MLKDANANVFFFCVPIGANLPGSGGTAAK